MKLNIYTEDTDEHYDILRVARDHQLNVKEINENIVIDCTLTELISLIEAMSNECS